MRTEGSKSEVLVNGNFATGDLTGWSMQDPAGFLVVQEAPSIYNCVIKSQPWEGSDSLRQGLPSVPGKYRLAVWYRSCDEMGRPTDKTTNFSFSLFYRLGPNLVPTVAITTARPEWYKHTWEFELPRDAENFQFSMQNLDDAPLKQLFAKEGIQLEQTHVAVRDVSLWKM